MVMCIQKHIIGYGFKDTARSALLAGLNWNNATHSGSQGQNANNYRWNTNSNIRARFLTDPRIIQFLTPIGLKLAKLTPWLESNSLLRNEQNTKQETEAG